MAYKIINKNIDCKFPISCETPQQIENYLMSQNPEMMAIISLKSTGNNLRTVSHDCTYYSQNFDISYLHFEFIPREIYNCEIIAIKPWELIVDLGFGKGSLRKDQITKEQIFFDEQNGHIVTSEGKILFALGDTVRCMVNSAKKERGQISYLCSIKSLSR